MSIPPLHLPWRGPLPAILALSWCALFPAYAGRPYDPSAMVEPPLPEHLPLFAQNTSPAPRLKPEPVLTAVAPEQPTPSQSVTINLIYRLVERGVLTKEDSAELMQQAETDAAEARLQAAAAQQEAVRVAVGRAAEAAEAAQAAAWTPDPALLAGADDAVRVTYIPENVKAEMREQIRADVMNQAREERWAAPRQMPEWALKLKLFGDVRVRYDGTFFPSGNDNTGAFPNFNAINTGAPFDVAGTTFSPQLNVDQDRQRIRLRVRLGLEADLGNGFGAGLRLATGESNSPVSTNQSLGLANQGQGGNFSKYAIWLDRGFLSYTVGSQPNRSATALAGRFENPFYRTSEIIWDDDLGFDGLAVQGRYEVGYGLTPFFAGGAFPVFNTDFNFSSNQPAKFQSSDKWLYGGQLGTDWKIRKDLTLKVAAAYYHFDNVEGQLSDPFIPLSAADQGNTDDTRPSFAQKGNTYRPLRRIIASPLNNFGTTNQYQYFGLATPFHELHLAGNLTYGHWEPFQLSLYGEYVKNLAFDRGSIEAFAVNNRGPNSASGSLGAFAGGDTGWLVGLKAGHPLLLQRGDWQVGVNYRYVESDATVDGFTDSDFGLGGTNLKGYTLYGSFALSPNFFVSLRWMSSDEVSGPPLRTDTLLFDVNGKF